MDLGDLIQRNSKDWIHDSIIGFNNNNDDVSNEGDNNNSSSNNIPTPAQSWVIVVVKAP